MLVLMSGGMNIIESFMFYQNERMVDKCGWYAGCIIGAFIGAILCYRISTRISLIAASSIVTLGGLISASDSDISFVTSSQWLDGIGCGIAFVIIIAAGGELALDYQRGRVLSMESLGLGTGILLYSVIRAVHDATEPPVDVLRSTNTFTMTQVQGVISIFLGLAAGASTYFCYDTPVSFLLRDSESQALQSIQHFQNELAVSPFTYNMLEECRLYIIEDRSRSFVENVLQGSLPFAKLCIVRTFMSLTMAFPIVSSYYFAGTYGFQVSWCFLFFGLSRWIGNIIGHFILADIVGRKKTLAGCSLIIGILFIVIGAMSNNLGTLEVSHMVTIGILILLANLFCGMVQNVSTVYLSEAFSLSVKNPYIFAVLFVENLSVIIAYASFSKEFSHQENAVFYLVVGSFMIIISIMAVTVLPETKRLNLRQARTKFCDLIIFKF
ncbi:hypothetical protein ACFFRR_010401 [Megaselia abdita]